MQSHFTLQTVRIVNAEKNAIYFPLLIVEDCCYIRGYVGSYTDQHWIVHLPALERQR